MNEATMDSANPYSTPDAELNHGQGELYTPSIISFNGRIGRLRYLAYAMGINCVLMLAMGAAMAATMGASTFMAGSPEGMPITSILIGGVFYIGIIVVSVMFAKRRLNDLNRSGWWCLLLIVPIAGQLLAIYMLFFPGTDGNNNWGSAPDANSLGVLILGWMVPVFFVLGIVAAIAIPQLAGTQP
jgi:uncharacterized membrane protein YhaH (DUF805 family)